MFQDLLLNIISEAIGILVTVFIIDRIIQRNEIMRWKPAKCLYFARLLGILENFLNLFLRAEFLADKKGEPRFYEFGKTMVYTTGNYHQIPPDIIEGALQGENKFLMDAVAQDENEIKDVQNGLELLLATSLPLTESNLMTELYDVQNEITSLVRLQQATKTDQEAFVFALMRALAKAISLHGRLENIADRSILADEYLKGVTPGGKQVFRMREHSSDH